MKIHLLHNKFNYNDEEAVTNRWLRNKSTVRESPNYKIKYVTRKFGRNFFYIMLSILVCFVLFWVLSNIDLYLCYFKNVYDIFHPQI